jgi:DNA polymerase-1
VLKTLRDDEGCQFCAELLEYKKYDKMMNTFIEPVTDYVQSDGKIRASFHDTGTVTGRLSSSRPNLQQLPREGTSDKISVRELFASSPGYTMIAADYSGQEVALCAHVSQDQDYIDILLDGLDMHLYNANLVFDLGIPYEKMKKSHPEYTELKKKYKENGMRTKAKIFTFGILYGATKYRIADEFGCSLEEAEQYIENYFKGFQGLKDKIDSLHEEVDSKGFVRSLFGRKRRFKKTYNDYTGRREYSPKDYRQSFNFVVQSPGTDMVRAACVKLMNYKHRHPEYDVRLLMTVHDEVVLECKDEYVDVVAGDVPEILASVGGSGLAVPMKADADVGKTYASAK